MTSYQLRYKLGLRVSEIVEVRCETEEAALRIAERCRDWRAMELWRGDELLASWAANGERERGPRGR